MKNIYIDNYNMFVIILILIISFLAFFLQSIIHELSHAIIYKIFGATDIKIYPYPKWEGSLIPKYWAYIKCNIPSQLKNWQYGLISSFPQIINTFFLMNIFIINYFSTNNIFSIILKIFFITNYIDGSVNLCSIFKKEEQATNDTWNAIKYFNINLNIARIAVIFWILVFLIIGLNVIFL